MDIIFKKSAKSKFVNKTCYFLKENMKKRSAETKTKNQAKPSQAKPPGPPGKTPSLYIYAETDPNHLAGEEEEEEGEGEEEEPSWSDRAPTQRAQGFNKPLGGKSLIL